MKTLENQRRVQASLMLASRHIAGLAVREWVMWLSYLLESLESQTDSETAEQFLADVREAVSERLAEGTW